MRFLLDKLSLRVLVIEFFVMSRCHKLEVERFYQTQLHTHKLEVVRFYQTLLQTHKLEVERFYQTLLHTHKLEVERCHQIKLVFFQLEISIKISGNMELEKLHSTTHILFTQCLKHNIYYFFDRKIY